MRISLSADARLLSGPMSSGAESLRDHCGRLGTRPRHGGAMVAAVRDAGLRGRGGSGFPTHRKWEAVADGGGGDARVVVNASEGEPLSHKDRTLLRMRPHLVLDGAAIAAEAVGARRIDVYLGRPYRDEGLALLRALAERGEDGVPVRVVRAPHRYVAGEESAAVRFLNGGPAKPWNLSPRPFVSGVDDRPTLVQNTETLAHVALIARYGPTWFRAVGTRDSPGTMLLTVRGAVERPSVVEVPMGTPLPEAVAHCGGPTGLPQAVLIGGYFGTWLPAAAAVEARLDHESLRAVEGASLGCGVVHLLSARQCGVAATAAIIRYLADESAGQCGPCVFGLRSLAEELEAMARGSDRLQPSGALQRWSDQIEGRGACRHPDGAVRHLRSALCVFAADFAAHRSPTGCAWSGGAAA